MLTSLNFSDAVAHPVQGIWRPLLRSRLHGRAEPLLVEVGGLRSAASLWSGAQVWVQLLRTRPDVLRVRVCRAERLALLQLLVAVLWDGRTLEIEPNVDVSSSGAWSLDGRQVMHDDQTVCLLGDGGWPDLMGSASLSVLDMLAAAPMRGDIVVRGRRADHGALWLTLSVPPGAVLPTSEAGAVVLPDFDLAALATPHDLLNDALVPLLHFTEVWECAAWPTA